MLVLKQYLDCMLLNCYYNKSQDISQGAQN